MKAGTEVHYLAGQIFTLGIAAVAILPRMPGDPSVYNFSIGGKLSYPFRRALIGLVCIGWVRVLLCHVLFSSSLSHDGAADTYSSMKSGSTSTMMRMITLVDAMLGTIHVVGQTFLCLTTAYLLQYQLSDFINVDVALERQMFLLGGSSLPTSLVIVSLLTFGGAFLSELVHPNYWCLVNLAEAYSCFPVLNTLTLYASITTTTTTHNNAQQGTGGGGGRGLVLTQILMIIEYWYLITSLFAFLGEATMVNSQDSTRDTEMTFFKVALLSIRHNQDNGVDDWTRLVLHSVFLNSIDELQHMSSFSSSSSSSTSPNNDVNEGDVNTDVNNTDGNEQEQSLIVLHNRKKHIV